MYVAHDVQKTPSNPRLSVFVFTYSHLSKNKNEQIAWKPFIQIFLDNTWKHTCRTSAQNGPNKAFNQCNLHKQHALSEFYTN